MTAEVLPTYAPWELRGLLEDMGRSEEAIELELKRVEAEGRLTSPLEPPDAPRKLTLERVHNPPVEKFLLGRMFPLAKASVLFGPTGAGKSAALAQLVFSTAGHARSLWGLACGVSGPVLVVSAEDSLEDWERKAAAVNLGTEIDVERALADVHIRDLSDGEARLSEVVTERDRDTTRRVSRATPMADSIIEQARKVGAVLIVVETASRLVDDEDNASFAALQAALGRIARRTGASVIVTHHATKAASRANDNSIENARGGGAFIYNARNAVTLFPAEPEVVRSCGGRFPASDVFTLAHGKSTSSTRREAPITLVRCGTAHGAVFQRPEDIEQSPEVAKAMLERAEQERAVRQEELCKLFALVATLLKTRPALSPTWLVEKRFNDLGITKRRMEFLVGQALADGILKIATRTARGTTLALGFDPSKTIKEQTTNAAPEAAREDVT